MKAIAFNLIACGLLMLAAHWLSRISSDTNGLIMFMAGMLFAAIAKD